MKDDSDHLRLLSSINMLNEGVHVQGVSLFGQTELPIICRQQIGRTLTMGTQRPLLVLNVANSFGRLSRCGMMKDSREILMAGNACTAIQGNT